MYMCLLCETGDQEEFKFNTSSVEKDLSWNMELITKVFDVEGLYR